MRNKGILSKKYHGRQCMTELENTLDKGNNRGYSCNTITTNSNTNTPYENYHNASKDRQWRKFTNCLTELDKPKLHNIRVKIPMKNDITTHKQIQLGKNRTVTIQYYPNSTVLLIGATQNPVDYNYSALSDVLSDVKDKIPINSPEIHSWNLINAEINVDSTKPNNQKSGKITWIGKLDSFHQLYNKAKGSLRFMRLERREHFAKGTTVGNIRFPVDNNKSGNGFERLLPQYAKQTDVNFAGISRK